MKRLAVLLAFAVAACGGDSGGVRLVPGEAELRDELGIPRGARRVMIVSQSSHLDLNFQRTYDDYWETSVRSVLASALDLLDREPGYRYSVAEVAFLRRYWDEVPADRERLRRHAASGRLRIVGGGLSSPDSLLPTGESLLRDWLAGIRWVEAHLGVRPRAAWQPDSFGHAPTLPSLLEHLGFDSVAFFRIDGGLATVPASGARGSVPSTAETLTDAGAADFLWRAPDGAELVARWMPFGYAQGDALDFDSDLWATMSGLGIDWNTSRFVVPEITNDRFQTFIDQLDPYRRTPYLFLPIGVDFSWPKPDLLAYVDRWNRERYPATGVWIVAGTFEELVRLLEPRRAELPTFELDMSPYWTGFYSTRIELKRRVRQAHEALVAAEAIATVASGTPGARYPRAALERGWDRSAYMNHHDAITGTTTVESWEEDLIPWSEEALARGREALAAALGDLARAVDTTGVDGDRALLLFDRSTHARSETVELPVALEPGEAWSLALRDAAGAALPLQLADERRAADGSLVGARLLFRAPAVGPVGHLVLGLEELGEGVAAPPAPAASEAPTLSAEADGLVLSNGRVRAVLDPARGHCLVSLRFADSVEQLVGPSADVVTVLDGGGAYRLGSEIDQPFAERRASCAPGTRSRAEVLEEGPVRLAVRVSAAGDPSGAARVLSLDAGSDRLELEISASAPETTSLLLRFRTTQRGEDLTTSVPHGAATRPRVKLFDPTFWPATAWIDLTDSDGEGGLWLSAEGSRGWHADPDGTVETVLTRNVGTDGFGPGGSDPQRRTTRLALGRRAGRDWLEGGVQRLGEEAHRPVLAAVTDRHVGPLPAAARWLSLDRDDVELAALKLAEDGSGDVVLRLVRYGERDDGVRVTTPLARSRGVWRATGLEERLAPLDLGGGAFEVEMDRIIGTVRLDGVRLDGRRLVGPETRP